MKRFSDLDEREVLALAISLEEEHGRIYADYASGLTAEYPASARIFSEMADEENERRRWLIDLFRKKFGNHIPLIRRQDVTGFVRHDPIWMVRPLGLDKVRKQAEAIETETMRFYRAALERASDAEVRKRLGDLAAAEGQHVGIAQHIADVELTPEVREAEARAERRAFVLRYVQPGLTGLIDGSVSTLAPISPPRLRRITRGRRFSSASQLRWAPAFRWHSPRPWLTTVRFPDAAIRGCVAG
jgi:rubrerythrin